MNRLLITAMLAAAAASALADVIMPPGWSQREGGAYVHQQSTAVCPLELAGFRRITLQPGAPPVLGICTYAKGPDMTGVIRVRTYVPDPELANKSTPPVGHNGAPISTGIYTRRDTPLRIKPTDPPAPHMQKQVMTIARGGLLIDCESTFPSKAPPPDFDNVCMRQFEPG